jgi:hypothetical protein
MRVRPTLQKENPFSVTHLCCTASYFSRPNRRNYIERCLLYNVFSNIQRHPSEKIDFNRRRSRFVAALLNLHPVCTYDCVFCVVAAVQSRQRAQIACRHQGSSVAVATIVFVILTLNPWQGEEIEDQDLVITWRFNVRLVVENFDTFKCLIQLNALTRQVTSPVYSSSPVRDCLLCCRLFVRRLVRRLTRRNERTCGSRRLRDSRRRFRNSFSRLVKLPTDRLAAA